jgi:hypothetical protein
MGEGELPWETVPKNTFIIYLLAEMPGYGTCLVLDSQDHDGIHANPLYS